MTHVFGFIGGGQMAQALASGFVEAGLSAADRIHACDPSEEARTAFRSNVVGATVTSDPQELLAACDVVFLSVKPQHLEDVFGQLTGDKSGVLFVSIVAGATLGKLGQGLGVSRVIRVMPNTPCLVGAGAAGYCLGDGADPADGELVRRLLGAVGIAHELPEPLLDAVTGLSGSGPAFVYQVIEALSDGGVLCGMPRAVAMELAAQTVFGAARMVLETGEHPGVLKDRVASPGGTTIAGLHALEQGRLRGTLMDAVHAASRRSAELGRD